MFSQEETNFRWFSFCFRNRKISLKILDGIRRPNQGTSSRLRPITSKSRGPSSRRGTEENMLNDKIDGLTLQEIDTLQDQAKNGNVSALKCLIAKKLKLSPEILCESIRFNRHELIEIIVNCDFVEIECWFLTFSIRHGSIDCLRHLLSKFVRFSAVTCSQLSLAVQLGNEECVRLLIDFCRGNFRVMASPAIQAVHLGKVSIVELFPLADIFSAVQHVLFFDRLRGPSGDVRCRLFSSSSSRSGRHFPFKEALFFQSLSGNGTDIPQSKCDKPKSELCVTTCCDMIRVVFSKKNYLKIWNDNDIISAARFFISSGRSGCLKTLVEDCGIDTTKIRGTDVGLVWLAVQKREVYCLRILMQNRFHFSEYSIVSSVKTQQPVCLNLLLTSVFFNINKCHLFQTLELVETAVENGDVACIRILIEHGAPISSRAFISASKLASVLWVPLNLLVNADEIRREFLSLKGK